LSKNLSISWYQFIKSCGVYLWKIY